MYSQVGPKTPALGTGEQIIGIPVAKGRWSFAPKAGEPGDGGESIVDPGPLLGNGTQRWIRGSDLRAANGKATSITPSG
jgi:hypothetical protein